jgi:hypothetical protein
MGDRAALRPGEISQQRRLEAQVRASRPRWGRQLLKDRELVRGRGHRWHGVDGSGALLHTAVIAREPDI